ncbi:MAG: Ldh family oxidoreductase [Planctomycetota bacterium]|nr:Ldh family oxidoreductase [Planctomycetota bacterium]
MSQLFPHQRITDIGAALFRACGASAEEASTAASALVQSSLMGHDSHGAMRIPEYIGYIDEGSLKPGRTIEVKQTGPTTAEVDCGYGFGAVGGAEAIRTAVEIARRQRTACVITRRCNHVGQLGAYVQMAAEAGMIALATCNSPINGHFVLPFGGREGRLATNPIAYGVPTGGDPIVADFSTSVAPEGKIRFYRNEGKPVPDGWILDANGQPTNDPNDFYGPPRGGILPLGGGVAHKGFALSLLVEILGSALAGVSSKDTEVFGNGVCFIVIDPASFCPLDRFRELIDETVAYMKSSPPVPGVDEVLVPGELEFRTLRRRLEEGIPVDEPTWAAIQLHADRLGVAI